MKPAAAGLYVHFPFCRRKCPYCHFFSLPAETAEIRSRVEAWRKGIAAEAALFSSGRSVAGSAVHETPLVFDTLYLGGGTPSLADPGDVARLKDDLAARLPCSCSNSPGGQSLRAEKRREAIRTGSADGSGPASPA